MTELPNATLGAIIVGGLLPPVISLIKARLGDGHTWNYVISLVVSFIAAIAILVIDGVVTKESFDAANLFVTLATIITAAQTAYATFWKPSGTDTKIQGYVGVGK